ncbi:MAG TPA: TatD family hydrolase [Myxococcaceae bacterium]|nr:TatD family hydrolase [Myxococcaceae bacterium]
MRLVDGHCHLEPGDFPDVRAVLERMAAAGVVHAVVVGQFHRPGDFGTAVATARARPDRLTATLGIHPHEAARATEADFAYLEEACGRPEVHAVGEAGLDFYYDRSPRDVQDAVFRWQCALSLKVGKPLVVHVRDAHAECAAILRSEKPSPGVIHCFTGDLSAARTYLDLGFHLSISGVVTYKKTEALAEAVRFAPLDRLLVETDSPYLAPIPYRGRKNEPAYVVETARKVAELKELPFEEVAEATSVNAARMYGFQLPDA